MNNKVTSLILSLGVSIIFIVGFILAVSAMGYAPEEDPITKEIIKDTTSVSRVVSFSLIILWVALGAIALFTVFAIITNPKRFIPTAIGIAVFGVLVLIGYSLVNIETTGDIMKLDGATKSNLLLGGLGIKTTYVLITVAIGLIIVQGVRSLIGYFAKS